MKKTLLKLLVLLVAGGVLPWIAFFVGQIGSTIAIWAHCVGAGSVAMMMVYDWMKKKKS